MTASPSRQSATDGHAYGASLAFATSFQSAPLTSEEVARRQEQYGANVLPQPAQTPVWRRLASQLVHFFALMLWAAGAMAIFAGMPQLGLAIFVVIVLNGVFAFLQEYRAEKAGERLRDLLPRHVTVLRDATRQSIDAMELVPGDVVFITAGDRISADLRCIQAESLSVDTSTLTGESGPSNPQAGETIFAGTFAVEGEGVGVVTSTGGATRLAQIARLTSNKQRPPTPLAVELNRLVRIIAFVAVGLGAAFLIVALLVGLRPSDGFLFALGVTVALVPEGLLPTVTLSLAIGAQRMAARGALVRRLESVETLGSTTFICTDKTGTLTRNEMSVIDVWTPAGTATVEGTGYDPAGTVHPHGAPDDAVHDHAVCAHAVYDDAARDDAQLGPALHELARAAAIHATGRAELRHGRWIAQGNPLEVALDVFARRLGLDVSAEEAAAPLIHRFPFDPRRRRMSLIAGHGAIVRGAPEAVLDRCRDTGPAQAAVASAERAVARMTDRGLRVVAIAVRDLPNIDLRSIKSPESVENDLTLVGLLGIQDPPRANVADSIAACRRAGIRVAMITGDHSRTALAIARETGLWVSDELAFESKDLPHEPAALGALLDHDGVIVSRVSPEEKLLIARALRARGHVVAMTGDGVNDAPALHEADIGIAMGFSGTDVAREAADLVLLDDNFATIVAAIEQGRTTFANARRFLTYHLTDNVAELTPFLVWALSGGRFPLALGVLQVLCLDIGTDILPAVALGAEPSSPRALAQPSLARHLVDRRLLFRAFGVLGLTESFVEMAAFLAALYFSGWRPGVAFPTGHALLAASGAAFTAVVAGQIANAFACRSASVWPGKLDWFSNRYLVIAIACEIAMLLGFLYIPPVARILGNAPPSAAGYGIAVLAIPAVLLADLVHKHLSKRR